MRKNEERVDPFETSIQLMDILYDEGLDAEDAADICIFTAQVILSQKNDDWVSMARMGAISKKISKRLKPMAEQVVMQYAPKESICDECHGVKLEQ